METVWLAVVTSDEGDEVEVFASPEGARGKIAEWLRQDVEMYDEYDAVEKALNDGDVEEALSAANWAQSESGDVTWYTLTERPVQP